MRTKLNFYTKEQVNAIAQEIKAGKNNSQIAREYSKKWNRSFSGVYVKVMNLRNPKTKVRTKTQKVNDGAVVLSSGFVFDFKPQRAEMHKDHVRLYF